MKKNHIPCFFTEKKRKTVSRRFGADMTQALLFSAFVIALFVGVLYGFNAINLNKTKTQTTTMISAVSGEIRGLFAGTPNFDQLSTDKLVMAGVIPQGYARQNDAGQNVIEIPYGGKIEFLAADEHSFKGDIVWDFGGRNPKALCLHLSSTDLNKRVSGPMGVDYEIIEKNCYSNPPALTALYHR